MKDLCSIFSRSLVLLPDCKLKLPSLLSKNYYLGILKSSRKRDYTHHDLCISINVVIFSGGTPWNGYPKPSFWELAVWACLHLFEKVFAIFDDFSKWSALLWSFFMSSMRRLKEYVIVSAGKAFLFRHLTTNLLNIGSKVE